MDVKKLKKLQKVSEKILHLNKILNKLESLHKDLCQENLNPIELNYYKIKLIQIKNTFGLYFYKQFSAMLENSKTGEILHKDNKIYIIPMKMTYFSNKEMQDGKVMLNILEKNNGRYTGEATLYQLDLVTGNLTEVPIDNS